MERDWIEDKPLLPTIAEQNTATDTFLLQRQQRRRCGLRRADVACLAVVCFVACFVVIRQPELRTDNPIWHEPRSRHRHQQYMTYSDIDAKKRRHGYHVTYTERGFVIDGKETLLLGGSIHYPRSTPGMWEDLLLKAKHDGLNHIELYVFWNLHERERGIFNFAERANITQFYDLAAQMGMFLHVRFGPYVCAEWDNGGLPLWLNWIPDMHVRSNNVPWKTEMERFVRYMVELSRPYLASNGGPIILAQIENEFNGDDEEYIDWCGNLVQELDTSIPWVMCNGKAAANTILTCNGNDCVDFALDQAQHNPSQPFMWTENEGWYEKWADDKNEPDPSQIDQRRAADVAYAVARWFAIGGASHNYYMYHGGNNYGRSASAGVTTMYANGVNLHSDGLSNEPKRSHLRKLHEALITCNNVLMGNHRQLLHPHELDAEDGLSGQRAFIYGADTDPNQVVFLENNSSKTASVNFHGSNYDLAKKSVVILKGGDILYNTSDVQLSYPHREHRIYTPLVDASDFVWKMWSELDAQPALRKRVTGNSPIEQIRLTADTTDYLAYETTVDTPHDVSSLTFTSCEASSFLVFLNETYIGEKHLAYPGGNCSKSFQFNLSTLQQDHETEKTSELYTLKVLSVSLGVYSLGHDHKKGLIGDIYINDHQSLIGTNTWTMYPGMLGEQLEVYNPQWVNSVPWKDVMTKNTSLLTWYKTTFRLTQPTPSPQSAPVEAVAAILLDGKGLTRGRAYINGHDLGRYWLIMNDQGEYIQRYYHIPTDWLHKDDQQDNLLMLFDELGGSISDVRVVLSTMIEDTLEDLTTTIMQLGAMGTPTKFQKQVRSEFVSNMPLEQDASVPEFSSVQSIE